MARGCRGVNAEEAHVTCIGRALRSTRTTTRQGNRQGTRQGNRQGTRQGNRQGTRQGQAGHRGTVTRPPKAFRHGATPCAMRLVSVIGEQPLRATCLINVTRPRTAR
jgi:hypothetical protein